MPDFSPFIEMLLLLPAEALRRSADYYRSIADRLEFEARRREPLDPRHKETAERVRKVNAAADAAARALARGEPRERATWDAAVFHHIERDAIEVMLPAASRRLRRARDAAAGELALAGKQDHEIASELRRLGFAASVATVRRVLRKARGDGSLVNGRIPSIDTAR
ncbi:MAG TPA: hypothetical protein VMU87_01315 [Stellaceae bacterium]|nr:hypothetical protein [Stellaceae bacterium]